MGAEVAARVRQHAQGLGAPGSILKERRLAQRAKTIYADAVCATSLTHNGHTWAALGPPQVAQLGMAILRRARRTAGLP